MREMDTNTDQEGQGDSRQQEVSAKDNGKPKLNPLLFPNILEKIFEGTRFEKEDLVQGRTVCREWRNEITKAYAAQSSIYLSTEQSDISKMFIAIDLLRNVNSLPLPRKLHVDSAFFCLHRRMLKNLQRYFEKFLGLLAPSLEEVGFSQNYPPDDGLEFASRQSVIAFPKVKSCFFFMNQNMTNCQEYFLQLCSMVMDNSLLLEEVKICSNLRNRNSDDVEAAEQMLDERLLRRVPGTVKSLSLMKPLQVVTTQILAELPLVNLEILELEPRGSHNLDHADFCEVFTQCHMSLKDLTVRGYNGGVQFPPMPHLEKLALEIGLYNRTTLEAGHSLHPFHILFPSVTRLFLADVGSMTVLNSLFPEGFTAPKVKICSFPDILTRPETIRALAVGFSGLKRIVLSPFRVIETLPIIFGNMGQLEEMYIRFRGTIKRTCVDSVFTGIPRNVCRAIRTQGNWDVDLDAIKTSPGISDLKNLKKLQMNGTAYRKLFVTDVSAYLGILKSENLALLETDRFEMTDACLSDLTARFGEKCINGPHASIAPPDIDNPIWHDLRDFTSPNDESDTEFDSHDWDEDSDEFDVGDLEVMDGMGLGNWHIA